MAKVTGRAKHFAAFEERAPKDFDPETDVLDESLDSESSDESFDENAGTEHYVSVGKSKLRQNELISLGPQYRGSRVSRAALNDENDSDRGNDEISNQSELEKQEDDSEPEESDDAPDSDLGEDERNADDIKINSHNTLAESNEERFKDLMFHGSSKPRPSKQGRANRPTAADFMESDNNESDSREGMEADSDGSFSFSSEHEDDSETCTRGTDSESVDEEEEGQSDPSSDESEGRSVGLSGLFSKGLTSTISNLSASAQKETAQGLAFRQQRKTFDAILNVRVRLQKSLVAINTFSAINEDSFDDKRPYQAAEEAAIKLWNSLDNLRATIQPDAYATSTRKRQREADLSTSSQELWENMKVIEKRAAALRKSNLEKWSKKANRGYVTATKFNGKQEFRQTLTSALDGQLTNPERLTQKTQVPRSCAPVQAAKKLQTDPDIYDDADFYQMLLKELLDQRTSESSGPGNGVATVVWTAKKAAKQKKLVDTKASKGRKMRFNVHEKIQNFMAPDDRRSWEQPAVDRLFGSLFGKEVKLDDENESDETENEDGTAPAEEQNLRLFKT